jgi:hypothetical protein
MARTVDASIEVPAPYAYTRAEVADAVGDGGFNKIYRCVNTLYRQKYGQLVNDCAQTFLANDAIIDAIGEVASYRVKLMSHRDLGTNNPTIEVWAYMRIVHTNTDSVTMRAATVNGGDSNTAAANVTGSGTTDNWFGPISNVQVTDTPGDGFEQIDFDITAAGPNITSFDVYSIMARYETGSADLPAGDYTGDPFTPMDVAEAAGEKPVTVARLHHLHENLRTLYEQRVGMISATSFPDTTQHPEDFYAMAVVPSGVTTVRFWFKLASKSGTAPGVSDPWVTISTSDAQTQGLGNPALGWFGGAALDLAVTPGTTQQIQLISSTVATGFTTKFSEFSCWFLDGDY